MASTSKTDKKSALKILQAAAEGNLRALKNAAKKLGKGKSIAEAIASVTIWYCSEDGTCVLHIAAANGRTEICKYLIEDLKFDSNLVHNNGKTPIFRAICGGHIDTVRYLLDHGANPDARDIDGFSPLHSAVLEGEPEILDLLLSRGGLVEATNFAGTPLILATCLSDYSCMKVLLDHSVDVSDGFFSPLFVAVTDDSIKCVEILIKAGADVNKISLLELAFDSVEMFDYLLEAGADPNKHNDHGRLPIEIAALRDKREVVEKLFPLTSPIPVMLDWSIDGLFRHVASPTYHVEEELQSKKRLESLKKKVECALSAECYLLQCRRTQVMQPHLQIEAYVGLQLGDGFQALFDAYNCRELYPKWPISYLCLGSALGCLKKYEQACMELLKGLNLDPTNREIQKALQQTMEHKTYDTQLTYCKRCRSFLISCHHF